MYIVKHVYFGPLIEIFFIFQEDLPWFRSATVWTNFTYTILLQITRWHMLDFVTSQVKDFQFWELRIKKRGQKQSNIVHMAYLQGSGKKLNLNLPFLQAALKFCLPWASLNSLIFNSVYNLPGPFSFQQARMKSFSPGSKVYLFGMTSQHFFQGLI